MFVISLFGITSYYLKLDYLLYVCGSIIFINNLINYIKLLSHHKFYFTTRPIFYSLLGMLFYNNIISAILIGLCIKEFVDNIIKYFVKFMKKVQK